MRPRIGFADDDRFYGMMWVGHLKQTYEVEYFRTAAEVVDYVESNADLRCLVLDVMMPTPDGFSEDDTGQGLATGVWILKRLKEHILAYPLPVVMFTNRPIDTLIDAVRKLGVPSGLIEVRRKMDTSRKDLETSIATLIVRN